MEWMRNEIWKTLSSENILVLPIKWIVSFEYSLNIWNCRMCECMLQMCIFLLADVFELKSKISPSFRNAFALILPTSVLSDAVLYLFKFL